MFLEVIAVSLDDALAAEQGGASRLEVVAQLAQDGLTPALALIEAILARVHIPIRVMIRERNSLEISSDAELTQLCALAQSFAQLPVDGLVLGAACAGTIDTHAMEHLCAATGDRPITFHRAFDACADPIRSAETLARWPQVDWVLTSGGSGDWTARAKRLHILQQKTSMCVLVGGGVDEASLRLVCEHTPLRAFHVGRAAREPFAVDGVVTEWRVAALVKLLRTYGGA